MSKDGPLSQCNQEGLGVLPAPFVCQGKRKVMAPVCSLLRHRPDLAARTAVGELAARFGICRSSPLLEAWTSAR